MSWRSSAISCSAESAPRTARRRFCAALGFSGALALPRLASAGAQQYEPLADAVRNALAAQIADPRPPVRNFADEIERLGFVEWMTEMSSRLERRKPESQTRSDFLRAVDYEATRAGLERQLVLGLIQVESNFRKYAISSAGARGYMQVMPFWTKLLGDGDARKLFDLRTNLRYGCVILRHYIDIEKGDLFHALGRYNSSRGRTDYPRAVLRAWKIDWAYQPKQKPRA